MKSQSLSLLVLLAYQYTSLIFANYRYTLHCVFCLVSVKQPTSTHREPFFHRWSQWAQCYVGRVFSENRLGRRKLILILVKSTPPPPKGWGITNFMVDVTQLNVIWFSPDGICSTMRYLSMKADLLSCSVSRGYHWLNIIGVCTGLLVCLGNTILGNFPVTLQ